MNEQEKKTPRPSEQWAMFLLGITFCVFGTAFGLDDRPTAAIGCMLASNYLAARLWLTKGFLR